MARRIRHSIESPVSAVAQCFPQRFEETRAHLLKLLYFAGEGGVQALRQVFDLRLLFLVLRFSGVERFLKACKLAVERCEAEGDLLEL